MSGFVCSPGDSFMPGLPPLLRFQPCSSAVCNRICHGRQSGIDSASSPELVHPVVGQLALGRGGYIHNRIFVQRLVSGDASFHCPERAGRRQGLPRSLCRHEPALHSWDDLPDL